MGSSINRYGLKRYIPAEIRLKIRKDAGFGCVLCGCILVDYEHIDPEFHHAKIHDSNRMTLLCITCHGRVTRKIISKKSVWDAKLNPKSLQDGFVHDLLFVDTQNMEVRIGNSVSKKTKVILTIHGKPIIWFEPPLIDGEPSKLCAIFYDDEGKAVSYVNRNQFVAYSDNQDVKSESTELSIVSGGIKCLTLDRAGGGVLQISKMQGRYLDTSVKLGDQGELIIKQGGSTMTLNSIHVENCGSAIHLGDPPAVVKYKKLSLAIALTRNRLVNVVVNLDGDQVGWVHLAEIFNMQYELVGFVQGSRVVGLVGDYIGELDGSHIVSKFDCYENGEPIFISKENIEFKERNPEIGYDVSFRLF